MAAAVVRGISRCRGTEVPLVVGDVAPDVVLRAVAHEFAVASTKVRLQIATLDHDAFSPRLTPRGPNGGIKV